MNGDNEAEYWSERYLQNQTGWNIGYASPPLVAYFDQLLDKKLRILVPGSGFGWEAAYLYGKGFESVVALDFSQEAKSVFFRNHPDFPPENFVKEDFFEHQGTYDLIVEHTFFSGLKPEKRPLYVEKAASLLAANGKLTGLLFNHEFQFPGPPFGGSASEYKQIFGQCFQILHMKNAYNSIKPRAGRELFCLFQKNDLP